MREAPGDGASHTQPRTLSPEPQSTSSQPSPNRRGQGHLSWCGMVKCQFPSSRVSPRVGLSTLGWAILKLTKCTSNKSKLCYQLSPQLRLRWGQMWGCVAQRGAKASPSPLLAEWCMLREDAEQPLPWCCPATPGCPVRGPRYPVLHGALTERTPEHTAHELVPSTSLQSDPWKPLTLHSGICN